MRVQIVTVVVIVVVILVILEAVAIITGIGDFASRLKRNYKQANPK